MSISNELEEMYVFAVQDPSDPVWAADADIAEMAQVDDPNDLYEQKQPTALRTSSGALDLLNELEGLVEETLGVVDAPRPAKNKLDDIGTREFGSDKWRGRTATVTANSNQPMLVKSDQRRMVRITNYGPNDVFLSSISGAVANGPNTTRMLVTGAAVNHSREFPTKDDIYAVCAPTQTAVVCFEEFFDMEC